MSKDFIGTTQAAKKAGVSDRRIRVLCAEGRIQAAQKDGTIIKAEYVSGVWMIPKNFKVIKPEDNRARPSKIKMKKAKNV